MPEHVHILLNEPPNILLDQRIKSFKQSTSRAFMGSRDQFWQARYFDRNITGEEARSEVIRCIHCNPVKRGLVTSPRGLLLEQLHPLHHQHPRHGRDRIRLDSWSPANAFIAESRR